MKKNYAFTFIISICFTILTFSCSKSDDSENYVPVAPESPVTVDLTTVPYQKLSEYKFFEGELKNLEPALNVLPFEPASSLFSDYAHKKRFIWMPKGKKATYNGDGKILELPVGAVLIKSFYYDNVQPAGGTKIIETRLMIKRENSWLFANYIWNEEQTEAYYNMNGAYIDLQWKDENNVIKGTEYRVPSGEQCIVCHKSTQVENNQVITTYIPIGIKPQNLNTTYNYETGSKNQLLKWIEQGYLTNNFSLPTAENSTIDYSDTSKSLDRRMRSYVDINCAHCHSDERHCEYRPMRFAYSETANNNTNIGVCVNTHDMQGFPSSLSKIITPSKPDRSMLYFRINTTDEAVRMPLHGRTMLHNEGITLVNQWINTIEQCD